MAESSDKTREFKVTSAASGAREIFEPGQIVGSKYKVVSLLGSGGMGTVYHVEQVFLKKAFALKTLESGSSSDTSMRRFQQEAKAASLLSHPNVVQVHDFGVLDQGQPYLVMDLVEGVTLAQYLKGHGTLALDQMTPIFAQACFGLMAAHERGIVHRDIKPSNIMLASGIPMGAEGSVKVLDFGIAKLTGSEEGEIQALTRTGEVFGSPLYMSPEQCSGGLVDYRSDIYSLGCVLFESLTGTPPHMGQNALLTMRLHQSGQTPSLREGSLGKQFPLAVERIVAKMLAKLPGERYQNLGLVAHDLAAACKGVRITETHSPKVISHKQDKVVSITRTHFALILALTAVTAAATSGLAGYFLGQGHKQSTSPLTSASSPEPRPTNATNAHDGKDEGPMLDYAASGDFGTKEVFDAPGAPTEYGEGKSEKFVFPAKSIGRLWSQVYKGPAAGTIYVPHNNPFQLFVDASQLDPAGFETVDPKAIYRLSLTGSINLDQSTKFRQSEADKVARILKIAGGWSNLKSVSLLSLEMSDSTCDALNNVKQLRDITLGGVKANDEVLCRQPFLDQLRSLIITKSPADRVVRRVAGSPNLSGLTLYDTDVSAQAILELHKCQHLSRLMIKKAAYDDQFVNACTQIKSLDQVAFVGGALSDAQLAMLIKCPWLGKISLSKTAYSADRVSTLQRLDPRIHLWKNVVMEGG